MAGQRSVALPRLADDQLGFFRWGRIAGKVLLTTDAGEWLFVSDAEFNDLLEGRIGQDHPRFAELQRKGVLRDGLDLDALASKIARRNRHLRLGPHVHVVTIARNSSAIPASESDGGDMSRETAEKVIDLALQTTAASIAFELQADGGDPLCNLDVVKHFVETARLRNKQGAGKELTFNLLSNLTALDEDAAEWLIANDVFLSLSFDGPPALHDANRRWKSGSSHQDVVRWIEYFARRYSELGRDAQTWCVEGLTLVTRQSLGAWREIVDEYVSRGLQTICLLPLDRFAVSPEAWSSIGYPVHEYMEFYRRALDYILELNRGGVPIVERTASLFLTKILTSDDTTSVDIQSPSSAGTGQVAYNFDGRIFPNDEARIVDAIGDSIFELGSAGSVSLTEVMCHPTVRAIAAASLLDAQPMCADCWNKPYCGFSPVHNFLSGGDLFGQRPHSRECKEHMAVSGRLFELLGNESDSSTGALLKSWTVPQPRFSSSGRTRKPAP